MPKELNLLIVSESPPPGKKPDYLYNLGSRDRLRALLSKVLEVPEERVPEFLRSKGILWTVAVKCRPKRKEDLKKMEKNCLEVLRLEIEVLRPKKILALGKVAERMIRKIDPPIPVFFDRHPLYMARFEKEGLKRLKEEILSDL